MAAERIMEHFSRWLITFLLASRISATIFFTPVISFTQRFSMPGSSISSSAVPTPSDSITLLTFPPIRCSQEQPTWYLHTHAALKYLNHKPVGQQRAQ